jgi:uncharacterized small protein (DUF1192 family)
MESDDIMRVSEADREILERVLNVRQILDLDEVITLLREEIKRAEPTSIREKGRPKPCCGF